jgi:hypothetical protein
LPLKTPRPHPLRKEALEPKHLRFPYTAPMIPPLLFPPPAPHLPDPPQVLITGMPQSTTVPMTPNLSPLAGGITASAPAGQSLHTIPSGHTPRPRLPAQSPLLPAPATPLTLPHRTPHWSLPPLLQFPYSLRPPPNEPSARSFVAISRAASPSIPPPHRASLRSNPPPDAILPPSGCEAIPPPVACAADTRWCNRARAKPVLSKRRETSTTLQWLSKAGGKLPPASPCTKSGRRCKNEACRADRCALGFAIGRGCPH